LKLPPGDVLIHAGDISSRGHANEVKDFLDWFEVQEFEHKIMIAGNHDFYFERAAPELIAQMIPDSITYLNDSGVSINGIQVWGSPVSPWFYDWAFNRHRGPDIRKHWDLIPAGTDIIITHGPVFQVLDKTVDGQLVGCADLLSKVLEIKPKVHICGHIHEAYGTIVKQGIKFINASVLDERYLLVHEPIAFEL
jgi:Icc-related predicted phosphoesterase